MSSSPVEYSIAPQAARDPYRDRRPPYSEDAEQAVLSAMLMDQDAVLRAAESIDDTMFYSERHRRIFRAMIAITERGGAVDPLTLSDELGRRGELEASGGKDYVGFLVDVVPTAANVDYHAEIVREKALRRRLIEVSTNIVQEAFESPKTARELLDDAESRIFQVAEARAREGFSRLKELLWPAMERIEDLHGKGQAITGVPSGFADLDEMTSGFQPADLVIVAARPSMGKCLASDSEIVLGDGSVVTIEEVVRRRSARLLTLGEDLKLRVTTPSAFVDDGIKPTFRVTTRLGRTVEATAPHPFLTVEGWKRLDELTVGRHIAVPRRVDVFGTADMREAEVKLLAYLIGDGGLTNATPRFTNGDARLREDFAEAVRAFGGLDVTVEDSAGTRTPSLSVRRDLARTRRAREVFAATLRTRLSPRGARRRLAQTVGVSPATVTNWTTAWTAPGEREFAAICESIGPGHAALAGEGHASIATRAGNPLTQWLDSLGLRGRGAADKFVPAPVFTVRRELLALFLNRLFATDGWATVLGSGQAQIGFASVSERLARQVQHLLLRFAIIGKLRRRRVRYGEGHRTAWQLDVTDARSLQTFAREIGIFGKEIALGHVERAVAAKRYQTNRDLVPVEVWRRLDDARGRESWASVARRAGVQGWTNVHAGRQALSRGRLAAFAEVLHDAPLEALAGGDVYWDEIVSIEFTGHKQVYDLTIPDTHNFVANDICVHNTAFTLNVAQHAAIEAQVPVAFFSLEMSKQSLVQRMLTSEARVDAQRLRRGMLRDDDIPRLARAAGILSSAPVWIDDTPGITLLEMRSKARRLMAEAGLGMVIVDYLQLMQGPSNSESRQQEVSMISRGLKALAKELNVPVVALSQLSRAPEQRTGDNKRPQLSDLRESGAIEQDADLIMFLYRQEFYDGPVDKDGNSLEGKAEVIVGKQRNGPIGIVNLFFHKHYTRFENFSQRQGQGQGQG